MLELSLDKAKEIIIEPIFIEPDLMGWGAAGGRNTNLLKFTRLLMAAEVYTINEIQTITKNSHDLVHLSGVHKFRYSSPNCKAEELRWFWTGIYHNDELMRQVYGLRQYIIDVCEASAFRAGKSRRPYGLFFGTGGSMRHYNHPWRTPEWYAARQPKKIPHIPVSEFYPFISGSPTEDHDLLLAVDALVPKGLNNATRADICQDMLVAILSGETTLENLADSRPKYMKQFFKQFPGKYGHLSLDAPIDFGDGTFRTIADTIAAEYKC